MALRLKNRWQSPIGGFQFTQPETGASFNDWGFNAIVVQIVNHRGQNPRFNLSTDPNVVGAEVDLQNATRMLSIPGGREFIADDGGGGQPFFPVPRPQRLPNAAVINRLGSGIGTMYEWLGEGAIPVSQELANQRASVCAVCPQNKPGDLTSWFTVPASNLIRSQLESRKKMKLATPLDDKINVCVACSCPLPLKVWVPIDKIVPKMNEDTKSRLDPGCWIKKEIS